MTADRIASKSPKEIDGIITNNDVEEDKNSILPIATSEKNMLML
jgi:hypothetical protein